MFSFLFGVGLFCIGVIGTFVVEPCLGMAVFALFTHITPQQLSISSFRPALVVSLATLVSYLLSKRYPQKFKIIPPEFVLFLIMLLGMFLGAYHAYDSQLAFDHFYTYCKYCLYFLMLVNIVESRFQMELFQNFLILSAAWMVYKCWDLRGTTGARFENMDGGVVGDSNQFAAALILLMPLVLMRVLRKGSIYIRVGALIGVFGIIMSVLITVSRAGFLGLAVVMIYFVSMFKDYRKRTILILVVVFIVVFPFVPQNYEERISSILISENQYRDTSSQSRLTFWKTAFDVWKEYPIYGCGLRNFIYYNGYRNEGKDWGEKGHVAHSLWFEALGEGGILVFLPLVAMLGLFFFRTSMAKKRLCSYKEIVADISALQIGMVGFLVCATFVNRLIYEPIYWWCGMAYIYHRRIEIN